MFFQAQSQALPWWWPVVAAFMGSGVPTIIWTVENRRRAKNEAKVEKEQLKLKLEQEREQIKLDLEQKHRENTERLNNQDVKLDELNELLTERKYVPAHGHRETTGPLHAENIFPKNRHGD